MFLQLIDHVIQRIPKITVSIDMLFNIKWHGPFQELFIKIQAKERFQVSQKNSEFTLVKKGNSDWSRLQSM